MIRIFFTSSRQYHLTHPLAAWSLLEVLIPCLYLQFALFLPQFHLFILVSLFLQDKLLKEEILKNPQTPQGLSWKLISKNLGGSKSVTSCRNRWKKLQQIDEIQQNNESTEKEISHKPSSFLKSSPGVQKSGPWSSEEDQMLTEIMRSNHPNSLSFSRVSEAMNYTRTPIQCQYRWKIIGSEARKSTPPSLSLSVAAALATPIEEIAALKKISRWSESEVRSSFLAHLILLSSLFVLSFTQIHELLLAVDQSVGTNSRINWVTVWSLMDRKRSVDDYRKKYRSVLLPQLKKNRLETTFAGGNQSLEYSLDEDINETVDDVIRKEIKKSPKKPPVKKRENHYWTEAEVFYLPDSSIPSFMFLILCFTLFIMPPCLLISFCYVHDL
jgi:hypothetical protein